MGKRILAEAILNLFMLRPIRDGVELENATEIIDSLAGHALNAEQEDHLDVLSTLVEEYEREHHALVGTKKSGRAILADLLALNNMKGADLSRLLGAHRSLGPKFLSRERALTAGHLKRLCKRFKVSADLFLR